MRIAKPLDPVVGFLVLVVLVLPGCAARSQNPATPAPLAAAAPANTPHCSDRVDRARTGNLVGTVLGTLAASLIGSPFLGVFYRAAGYVIGFASDSPKCPKADSPAQSNGSGDKPEPSSPVVIAEEGL